MVSNKNLQKAHKSPNGDEHNNLQTDSQYYCEYEPTEPELLAIGGREKFCKLCFFSDEKLLKNYHYRLFIESFCRPSLINYDFNSAYWFQEPASVLFKFWKIEGGFPILVESVIDTVVIYYTLPLGQKLVNDRLELQTISESHLKARLKIWTIELFGGFALPKFVAPGTQNALLSYIVTPKEELAIATPPKVIEAHFLNVSVITDERSGLIVEKENQTEIVLRFFPHPLPNTAYVSHNSLKQAIQKNCEKNLATETLKNFSQSFVTNIKVTTFLQVISEGNPIKLMVLRCFLRRCITAHIDGKQSQTALWLFGKQGTSKSTFAILSRKIVGEKFCEIAHQANQFAFQPLFQANVGFFSDLETMSSSHRKMLRQGIGRDTISAGIKNKNKTVAKPVFAQFLITSNKQPNQFGSLWEMQEIRERIIPLFFEKPIPTKYMTGNIDDFLDELLPFIWAWALFTPKTWLKQQVRSSLIVNLLRENNLLPSDFNRIPAIHDFIEQNILLVNESYLAEIDQMPAGSDKIVAINEVSITSSEFQISYTKWVQGKFSKKPTLSREQFLQILHVDYNASHVKLRRLGSRSDNRPERFWGIIFSNNAAISEKKSLVYKPCEMVSVSCLEEKKFSFGKIEGQHLENVVYGTMEPINFLNSLDKANFHETQKKILESRGQSPFNPI